MSVNECSSYTRGQFCICPSFSDFDTHDHQFILQNNKEQEAGYQNRLEPINGSKLVAFYHIMSDTEFITIHSCIER